MVRLGKSPTSKFMIIGNSVKMNNQRVGREGGSFIGPEETIRPVDSHFVFVMLVGSHITSSINIQQ